MKKTIVFVCIFLVSLVLLAPKVFLWGKVGDILVSTGIEVNGQSLNESFLDLHVNNVELTWNKIELVQSEEWNFNILGIYNTLNLQNNKTSFLSEDIPSIEIIYMLWDPLHVKVFIPLNDGEINGIFNLYEQKGEMIFSQKKDKKIPPFVRRFYKKSDRGYTYAFSL